METIWRRALPTLRDQLGERNFTTWIEPMRDVVDSGALRLEVPNRFFQEWVKRHFLEQIRDAVATVANAPVEIRVVVGAPAPAPPRPRGPLRASDPARARKSVIGQLVPRYTFETFVVGESNRVATDAARAVAKQAGNRYNPFFILGGVGLGKTHLANAVAHEFLATSPRRRMACLSTEAFVNSLIGSIRQDQMASFRRRYRQLDMLILDDIQFLAGKERTQEEFYHTFNALHAEGKQIVLTADQPAVAIPNLEQRLRSRFEGGLSVDIHPPTFEMRVAIAKAKAVSQGVDLPPDVAAYLAQHCGPSVRELEGVLTRIVATAAIRNSEVTLDLAWETLAPIVEASAVVTIEDVIERVSAEFLVSVADLKSHRRSGPLTYPRQIAMYLCRNLATASYPAIGEKFGGRDHTTVMHAVRVVERKREADSATASLLTRLEATLRQRISASGRLPGGRRHEPRGS